MGLGDMIERLKRAFSEPQPYERPPDLEHTRRVIDRQQTEIERLRQLAADEEQAKRYLRG